jgi:hypothetical protein
MAKGYSTASHVEMFVEKENPARQRAMSNFIPEIGCLSRTAMCMQHSVQNEDY